MLQKSKMQQYQSNTAELYCPNKIQYLTILVRYKLLFFLVRSPKAISIRRHSQTFKTRGILPPYTLLLLLLPYYRHFWKFFIPLSLLTTWFVHVPNLNPTCPPVARSYIFYYDDDLFHEYISQVHTYYSIYTLLSTTISLQFQFHRDSQWTASEPWFCALVILLNRSLMPGRPRITMLLLPLVSVISNFTKK